MSLRLGLQKCSDLVWQYTGAPGKAFENNDSRGFVSKWMLSIILSIHSGDAISTWEAIATSGLEESGSGVLDRQILARQICSYSSQFGNIPEHFWSALLFWHQECFICIYLMHSTKTATSQLFCIIENCVHKLLFSIKSKFGLHFIVISKQYNASFLA